MFTFNFRTSILNTVDSDRLTICLEHYNENLTIPNLLLSVKEQRQKSLLNKTEALSDSATIMLGIEQMKHFKEKHGISVAPTFNHV